MGSTLNNVSVDISQTSSQVQHFNMKKRKTSRHRLSNNFSSYYDKGVSIISNNYGSINPSSPDHYPRNEVIILGKRHKIIAKIVQRKISDSFSPGHGLGISRLVTYSGGSVPVEAAGSLTEGSSFLEDRFSEKSSDENVTIEKKKEIFSLYHKGVQVEGWSERVPENVARHIAYRLKCDTILDVFCEYGEHAIQVNTVNMINFQCFSFSLLNIAMLLSQFAQQ